MIETLLSSVAASAVTALMTFSGLYRFLGEKLFGHFLDLRLEREKERRDRELAELKHTHDEQIEELRAKIGHLADRSQRSNEREYAALAAIWDKFVELFDATQRCVAEFTSAPNLGRADDAALEKFLQRTDFTEGEKEAVRKAKDRNAAFARVTSLRSFSQAQAAYDTFRNVFDTQSIFIPKSLADQLEAGSGVCPGAIALRNAETMGRRPQGMTDDLDFMRERTRILSELRDQVRERLLYQGGAMK